MEKQMSVGRYHRETNEFRTLLSETDELKMVL